MFVCLLAFSYSYLLNGLGEYGYFANMSIYDQVRTTKVIAKLKALKARMDGSVLRERMMLASLQGESQS